ncbi:MAG: energy transducer TonB [Nitrospirae bacterium]|nr:energy transducer TonB [Nitrospirota bacterium]
MMGISKQPLLKFIGISAGLHLVAGALAVFLVLKTVRTIPSDSMIQVSLVNSVETVTVEASPPRRLKAPVISPSLRPVPTKPSKSFEAEAADSTHTEAVGSAPAREESRTYSAESPAREGFESRDEEAAGNGSPSVELAGFLQDVRSRLESAKRYPWLARVRGQEGTTQVRFRILPSGEPAEIQIVRSSEFPILDGEAVATVRRVSRFPPPPMDRDIDLVVPMVFRLNVPKDPE